MKGFVFVLISSFLLSCFSDKERFKDELGNRYNYPEYAIDGSEDHRDDYTGQYIVSCNFRQYGFADNIVDGYIIVTKGDSAMKEHLVLNAAFKNYGDFSNHISGRNLNLYLVNNLNEFTFLQVVIGDHKIQQTGIGKLTGKLIIYDYNVIDDIGTTEYECSCSGSK